MKSIDGLLSEIKHLIESTENGSTVLDTLPQSGKSSFHISAVNSAHSQTIAERPLDQTSSLIQ